MTIGIGVIGLGFMGRTHIGAYAAARAAGHDCRLVAVSDRDPARLTGEAGGGGNIATGSGERLFDPAEVRGHTDVAALLADPAVHLVSICTHTDTHVPLALAALQAGKHVLLEKPVALEPADVQRLIDASQMAGRLCMPAMCMRFWPEWAWLKGKVADGSLGKVRTAMFQRLGSGPAWAPEFYRNDAKSGGALFDLHIHDADFVCFLFGAPLEVSSAGTDHHVTTLYRFRTEDQGGCGPSHAVAEGGWDHAPGFPFTMRYVVNFEGGTAEFDLSRTPTLRLHRGGQSETIDCGPGTGYDGEVRHLLTAIQASTPASGLKASLADALLVTRLLQAERQSLRSGRPVAI
ncbi:MAG: Gfo/Idh/MocA family oxidoreductase [Planctomycetaceae bacterium]|jgi:predicted dehydrogenase|nr:Gfo/Idh/MocA family oxidoreductase [Planctomycetaceae bacterium]